MRCTRLVTLVLLGLIGVPCVAGAAVDSALIGTWRLEWQGAPIYWALREDGVYRLYGLGANPGQLGQLEASGGKFSMQAFGFADAGPYQLNGRNVWIVTGRLGPGTWKRVWTPGGASGQDSNANQACSLVTAEEVARVLREPVKAAPERRDPTSSCEFKAALSDFHSLVLNLYPSRRQAWENTRSRRTPQMIEVPGAGEDAYAEIDGGQHVVLRVLRGGTELRFTLTMKPAATPADVPLLGELARAADRRIGVGIIR
jgi:hypothetical protein